MCVCVYRDHSQLRYTETHSKNDKTSGRCQMNEWQSNCDKNQHLSSAREIFHKVMTVNLQFRSCKWEWKWKYQWFAWCNQRPKEWNKKILLDYVNHFEWCSPYFFALKFRERENTHDKRHFIYRWCCIVFFFCI